jgi:hypothetical protein
MAEKSDKPLVDSSDDGSEDAVGMPGQRKAHVGGKSAKAEPQSIKGVARPTTKKGK